MPNNGTNEMTPSQLIFYFLRHLKKPKKTTPYISIYLYIHEWMYLYIYVCTPKKTICIMKSWRG